MASLMAPVEEVPDHCPPEYSVSVNPPPTSANDNVSPSELGSPDSFQYGKTNRAVSNPDISLSGSRNQPPIAVTESVPRLSVHSDDTHIRKMSKRKRGAAAVRRRFDAFAFKARVVAAQLPELIAPGEIKVLNMFDLPDAELYGPGEIDNSPDGCLAMVKELSQFMLRLKSRFMSVDGKYVDYGSLRESDIFNSYKLIARELRLTNLAQLPVLERKAAFLNVYNSLTLHGVAKKSKMPRSTLEIRGFWRRTSYNLGGHVFSLDDIEHGVLRGNKPHNGRIPFPKDDPRRDCIVPLDPRIHFVLVCGAKSCPGIGVYTPSNMERCLEAAASSYVRSEVKVGPNGLIMPKIFLWYGEDFGESTAEIVDWCVNYMSPQQLEQLDTLVQGKAESAGKVDIQFCDYNWRLNVLPDDEPPQQ